MFGLTTKKERNSLIAELLKVTMGKATAELQVDTLEHRIKYHKSKEFELRTEISNLKEKLKTSLKTIESKELRKKELEQYFTEARANGLNPRQHLEVSWKEYQSLFQKESCETKKKFGSYSIITEPDEDGNYTIPELDIIPQKNWGKKVSNRDITWRIEEELCETKENLKKERKNNEVLNKIMDDINIKDKNQESLLKSVKEILDWYKSEELQFTPESKNDIKDMFLNLEIAYKNMTGTFGEHKSDSEEIIKEI